MTRGIRIAGAAWRFLTRERRLPGRLGQLGRRRSAAARRRRRQRGVALITVLIAISLTLVMTNQFSSSTTIDLIAAANYRDQVRAHFLARSALNLSELVIRLQQRIDGLAKQTGGAAGSIQITDWANQVMLAFCGSPEEVRDAVGDALELSKGLGADIGTCGVVGSITTEDDKLNLNCANNKSFAEITKAALDALVFFPAYDPVFEEADAEDWRRDRATQVNAIIDYIDSGTTVGAEGTGRRTTTAIEDYGYESLKDRYKPKNNFIDTVGEVKLARGVDDRFWTLFGDAFTAYGGCKVNLSAVSNVQLIGGILYLAAKDPRDPVLLDPQKLFALAGLVAKAKQFGMQFSSAQDFADFVKDPSTALTALAGESSLAGSQAQQSLPFLQQLTGGQKLGLELDMTKVNAMTTTGPRRTYRVEAWGEIDRKARDANGMPVFPPIRSTITGIWDTHPTPQQARKDVGKGAWVFLRED